MKTVLVVDDYEIVRLYHSLFLAQRGYRSIEASDGREALSVLQQKPVDLVLLDLVMPNMGGVELIKKLRADRAFAGLPIVAITSEAQRACDLNLGSDRNLRFLMKPVMPEALVQVVREMLDTKASTSMAV